jgi:hypothetical protein
MYFGQVMLCLKPNGLKGLRLFRTLSEGDMYQTFGVEEIFTIVL